MRFEASQHLKLGQHMKLAPRMIQSMEILQMPLAELEERVEQELESNATLEIAEARPDTAEVDAVRAEADRDATENQRPLSDAGSGAADFERLDSYESANPEAADNAYADGSPRRDDAPIDRPRARADGDRDTKLDAMAATPARPASLTDQLLDQWRLAEVAPDLRGPGELLIGFLDEDGYLRTPIAEIADRAPPDSRPDLATLDRALAALQTALDPPGIAARDMRECLLLQLAALERDQGELSDADETARWLVEDHLADLAQNRLPRIADRTGLSIAEIKAGIERLQKLSPAPARRLVNATEPPIIPDAIVEYDQDHDRYVAYLNETRLPNLQVNRHYAMMARDRSVPKKDREFLRTSLGNAQWLIDAIDQRRGTLLRVINVVIEAQREFFDHGPGSLKPLPMTQVADQLGVHVATVSRAVADKHLLTPRGIVPLRSFFTGGLATESGGEVSYDAVRAALREVIDAEDKSSPLSDEALVEALGARGIEIARRTVAKYRDQLGIATARMRKVY